MTKQMQEEAEAARRLTQLEVALRVAVRQPKKTVMDGEAIARLFRSYKNAGGYLELVDIYEQEGVTS